MTLCLNCKRELTEGHVQSAGFWICKTSLWAEDTQQPPDPGHPPTPEEPPVDLSIYRTVIDREVTTWPGGPFVIQDPGRGALIAIRIPTAATGMGHVYVAPNTIDPAHPSGVEWSVGFSTQKGAFPPFPQTTSGLNPGPNFAIGGPPLGYQAVLPVGTYAFVNLMTPEAPRDIKIELTFA